MLTRARRSSKTSRSSARGPSNGSSLSGTRARRVEVYSTNAAVALRGGDVVYLEETPQGWRITAAGCRAPAYAKPATCELQS